MLALALSCLFAADLSGEIACVAVGPQGISRVVVVDLATGAERAVGPGNFDGAPVWSPDGAWLAFETGNADGRGIFAVRADASGGRVISEQFRINAEPAWSPDGARIAYAAGDDRPDRIVVRALNGGRENVWGTPDVALRAPVWMPDPRMVAALAPETGSGIAKELQFDLGSGALIAVAIPVAGVVAENGETPPTRNSTDIHVVTARHAFPIPSIALPSEGRYTEWNPRPNRRGREFAYESNDGGDREIYLTTNNGVYNLSSHRAADWNPVWAPRGLFLAFESFRGGNRGIYRVNTKTSRVEMVAASGDADYWAPAWSPDAKWIICAGNPDGASQLYAVNPRTQERIRITKDGANAYDAPAWRPAR